jgi:hypothetical protein
VNKPSVERITYRRVEQLWGKKTRKRGSIHRPPFRHCDERSDAAISTNQVGQMSRLILGFIIFTKHDSRDRRYETRAYKKIPMQSK